MGKVKSLLNMPIAEVWRLYAPYWHICTAIIGLIVVVTLWYDTVSTAIAQTNQNTKDIQTVQQSIDTMRGEVHAIAIVLGVAKK